MANDDTTSADPADRRPSFEEAGRRDFDAAETQVQKLASLLRTVDIDQPDILAHLMELLPGMVYLRRRDGRFLMANQLTASFYNCPLEFLLQATPQQLTQTSVDAAAVWATDKTVIHGGVVQHLDECFRSSSAQEVFYHTIKVPYSIEWYMDGSGQKAAFDAVLSLSIDSTELQLAARQMRGQSSFDLLTGLANRNLLRKRIKQAILHTRRMGSVGALLFLDLDNFREINEVFGHISADSLLKQVAEVFTSRAGGGHVLARMSGDEFALLIGEVAEKNQVSEIAKALIAAFQTPFTVMDQRITLNLSIGICFFPEAADNYETLLKHADLALSFAKQEGGGRYKEYTPEMNVSIQRRRVIANQLRNAIDEEQFSLYYQPLINTQTGAVVGMEALIRWYQLKQPQIDPVDFIPIAEQTGLIVPIGDWVLKRAIEEQQAWLEQQQDLFLAVNLSTVQFQQTDLGDQIAEVLQSTGLDPKFLELEITESTIMQDMEEAIEAMQLFYDIGLGIAIDDFGTGYSSLSYLKRFPINKIKIDSSFVKDIGQDNDSENITEAIINLGHSLGLQVVAEGVELERHVSFLKGARADFLQGYFYAQPMPAEEFHSWVAAYQAQLPRRRRKR